MKGYKVLARALEASADHIYSVPGFPVTELSDESGGILVSGEKVAVEYALGHSLSGSRAAIIMKNVGLNACADPLIHATTQGLIGGVVVVSGDDHLALGSTNTEDSRFYGELGRLPVLEPGPGTCARVIEAAFSASERFSRIALVRVTPELLFSEAIGETVKRGQTRGRLAPSDLTMKGRADLAESLVPGMFEWAERSDLNTIQGGIAGVGPAPGDSHIVTAYPPPAGLRECSSVREIGRPFVGEHLCLSPPMSVPEPETAGKRGYVKTFCRNCPFIPVMEILKEKGLQVISDAGCSILALNPPFRIALASYGLGTAVGVAARSSGVALIGDYAMIHSGIPSLIDVYEKGLPLLCIVLDNRCMGMTGGQVTPFPDQYLAWADPVRVKATERDKLSHLINRPDRPKTILVEGTCPEGRHHEIVEC
ncbi:MAG: thiamine pyrophosphate-dependent enzyme [Methanoregulaceae archaeon]|nr:thiamine pyrophosphate-dependent enzyme [Methanoregulaceae archaeon]